MDQMVNQAAKAHYMSGGKIKVPIVFRTTLGATRRSAAQHSQSLHAWVSHVPGLKVALPSGPYEAKGLMKTAIRDDSPVVIFEDKMMYRVKGPVPAEDYTIPFGVAEVKRAGTDVTIVATSSMVTVALGAAKLLDAAGISAEVIDPRTTWPLDKETLVESAKKTSRAIVVEVGDEQKMEDPTVNLLCEMVAELLGKEAAVFLPSGTMCNEIALRVHARPGEEVIAHATAHPIHFETGGPGALAGVNMRSIDGPRGQFDAAAVEAAVRPPHRHFPRSRLLWVEQTSNLGGGSVWPLARINEVTAVAPGHRPFTHPDGARVMNAVVAGGSSAREYAAPFDSAWIDFTKGLGAPVGAAMAGSRAFIDEAWRCKQQMGGAMRQAGIIAAGGVYALRHHVKRLADDHANARRLAEGLAGLPGVSLDPATVETNIVFFELTGEPTAAVAVERLLAHGVRMGALGPRTVRACSAT